MDDMSTRTSLLVGEEGVRRLGFTSVILCG